MQLPYRKHKYDDYCSSTIKPAFVCSAYDNGRLMLYSHGKFDIWCVYEAAPLGNSSKIFIPPNPLNVFHINRNSGSASIFTGSFLEDPNCYYEFKSPKDVDYFGVLRKLARAYGADEVWETFNALYESIPQELGVKITREMMTLSSRLADKYPGFSGLRETFDCLLMVMIAENNRDGSPDKGYYSKDCKSPYTTKIGKMVKALGVFQTLMTDMPLRDIADYSKNKRADWIKNQCEKVGIMTPYISK